MQRGLVLLACTWVVLASCTPAAAAPSFSGIGKAKDGDSLMVGSRQARLFGIDAPEWDQICTRAGKPWACGQDAAEELSKLVTGRQLMCVSINTDEHGRAVSRCTAGSVDVNREMVSRGYATAYRRYSTDYVAAEESAKAAKRGLWAGTFQKPSDYRHAGEASAPSRRTTRRTTPKASASDWAGRASANCSIKGNRNSKGQWIYHMPGMPYYERTRPEDVFCTEDEAQAAGYRRARTR